MLPVAEQLSSSTKPQIEQEILPVCRAADGAPSMLVQSSPRPRKGRSPARSLFRRSSLPLLLTAAVILLYLGALQHYGLLPGQRRAQGDESNLARRIRHLPVSGHVRKTDVANRTLRFLVCNGFANQRLSIVYGAILARKTARALVLPRLIASGSQSGDAQIHASNDSGLVFDHVSARMPRQCLSTASHADPDEHLGRCTKSPHWL